jgi:hypothetical protein
MGYILLWIEHLAFLLLLTAAAVAVGCRIPLRLFAWGLIVAGIGLPFVLWAAATILLFELEFNQHLGTALFYPALLLCLATLAGGVALAVVGLSRGAEQQARGRQWPLLALLPAAAVVLLAHLVTFWNLDLTVQQQMHVMRTEAGALALSVAPPRVTDRENAATLYQQAFEAGLSEPLPTAYSQWADQAGNHPEQFNAADRDFVAYIERRRPVLALVREAAARPSCNFSRDWGRPSFDMLLPEIQHLRAAAADLQLEAHFKAARGDLRGALENVMALWRMAQHIGEEPFLVTALVSYAVDATAKDTLEHFLRTYPVTSDDLAVLEQWRPLPAGPRLVRGFRMEEAASLSMFSQIADAEDMGVLTGALVEGASVWPPNVSPLYRVFLLSDDVKTYRGFMRRFQQVAAQPYHEAKDRFPQIAPGSGAPMGEVTRLLLPSLVKSHVAAARTDAWQRLALLAIAAHRHRLEHGEFPATLSELGDNAGLLVPRDPFDGQPLRMVRRGDQLVLYSIGPDGKDDQGAEFNSSANTGDLTFTLKIAK